MSRKSCGVGIRAEVACLAVWRSNIELCGLSWAYAA
jgi:hypothetical protein